MNSKFAYLLNTAIENGKMNKSKTATEFINTYGTTECSIEEVNNTPEIDKFLKSYFAHRTKNSDKQLHAKFQELYGMISEDSTPKRVNRTYHAQEY